MQSKQTKHWRSPRSRTRIGTRLVTRLSEALAERDLDDLKKVLKSVRAALKSLRRIGLLPEFLDYVARCMDLDWGLVQLVERRFARLTIPRDPTLTDRVHLDIIEGLLHFHRSHYDLAFRSFQDATTVARRTSNDDLVSVSLYYQARAAWRRGKYTAALEYAAEAKEFAKSANLPCRVALIEMLEGWLRFLLGEFTHADSLVDAAEREMRKGNDHITMGDVWSYRGRRARQSGALADAITCFRTAILEYSKFDRRYRNVARCHANIAYVYYLQVRELRDGDNTGSRQHVHQQEELRRLALGHSRESEKIYNLHPSRTRRGRAKVVNDRSLLRVAASEWDKAIELADSAYDLGKGDPPAAAGRSRAAEPAVTDPDRVAMSNARVIACIVALNRKQFLKALRLAREALELADATENQRAQARARIHLGTCLLKFDNFVEADKLRARVEDLLKPYMQVADLSKPGHENRTTDYLVKDFECLRDSIDEWVASDDPTVVTLKARAIRGVTLQATLDNLEVQVISHVYEARRRNAELTAKELGIGDERVRRAVGPARRKPVGA